MAQYTIPTIVDTTARGERAYDVYSWLLSERIVFLGTEIDDGVANAVIAQLIHLGYHRSSEDIALYINSPGGSSTALMAIYDTIRFIRPDVTTYCIGQASSAAAVLLAAGTPGKRFVLEHSRVVLHQPSTGGQGTISDLSLQAKELLRTRTQVEEVLSRHTGKSTETLRQDTDRDLVLTASEAVDYGLADAVISAAPVSVPDAA